MNFTSNYIANICILLLVFLTFSCCSNTAVSDRSAIKQKANQPQKPIQEPIQEPMQKPTVEILTTEGRRVVYSVELAITNSERNIGLMDRSSLSKNRGMLFVFEQSAYQSFWMKNTALSLDMIFIGSNKKVVGTIENAQPFDESSHRILRPSKYVLEVNAGQVKANGISADSVVIFHDIDIR